MQRGTSTKFSIYNGLLFTSQHIVKWLFFAKDMHFSNFNIHLLGWNLLFNITYFQIENSYSIDLRDSFCEFLLISTWLETLPQLSVANASFEPTWKIILTHSICLGNLIKILWLVWRETGWCEIPHQNSYFIKDFTIRIFSENEGCKGEIIFKATVAGIWGTEPLGHVVYALF